MTSGQAVGRLSEAVEPVAQPAPEGDAEHAGYRQAEYSDDDQGADDHSGKVLEVWVRRDEGQPHHSKDQHRENDQREHEYEQLVVEAEIAPEALCFRLIRQLLVMLA